MIIARWCEVTRCACFHLLCYRPSACARIVPPSLSATPCQTRSPSASLLLSETRATPNQLSATASAAALRATPTHCATAAAAGLEMKAAVVEGRRAAAVVVAPPRPPPPCRRPRPSACASPQTQPRTATGRSTGRGGCRARAQPRRSAPTPVAQETRAATLTTRAAVSPATCGAAAPGEMSGGGGARDEAKRRVGSTAARRFSRRFFGVRRGGPECGEQRAVGAGQRGTARRRRPPHPLHGRASQREGASAHDSEVAAPELRRARGRGGRG